MNQSSALLHGGGTPTSNATLMENKRPRGLKADVFSSKFAMSIIGLCAKSGVRKRN